MEQRLSVVTLGVADLERARRFYEALGGRLGPEQSFDLGGQTVTEVAYRFEPIPR